MGRGTESERREKREKRERDCKEREGGEGGRLRIRAVCVCVRVCVCSAVCWKRQKANEETGRPPSHVSPSRRLFACWSRHVLDV